MQELEDAIQPVANAPPNPLVKVSSSLSYEAKSFEPRRNREPTPQQQQYQAQPVQLNNNMVPVIPCSLEEPSVSTVEKDETDNILNNNIIQLNKQNVETNLKVEQLEQTLNDINAANLQQPQVVAPKEQVKITATIETIGNDKIVTDENKNEASIAQVPPQEPEKVVQAQVVSREQTPVAVETSQVQSQQSKVDKVEPTEKVPKESDKVMSQPAVVKEAEPTPVPAAAPTPAPVEPKPIERKISLINYDKDQWSPDNPDGKRKYSLEQLRQLGQPTLNPLVSVKPALPASLVHVLDPNNKSRDSRSQIHYNNYNHDMIMPSFARNIGGGGGGSMGQYNKRPSQHGNNKNMSMGGNKSGSRSGEMMKRMSSHRMQPDVKLNEAENAWKPRHLQNDDTRTADEKEADELYRKFRSILNKLTPENFVILRNELVQCKITTQDRLRGCIKLVFEKAVSEPNYSVIYAQICKELSSMTVQEPPKAPQASGTQEKKVTFKTLLLNQCQSEFEKHKDDQTGHENKTKEIDEEQNDEKRKLMKEELDEQKTRYRRRAVGTVRFIGELYKINMLNDKIMHQCIQLLLSNEDEDSLECLCKLLTTIGKNIEAAQKTLDVYFEKLEAIANQKKNQIQVCSRIR